MKHFFDIGANVGQTFDDYLDPRPEYKDGWRIWCFEPSPRHVPALMDRARRASADGYLVTVCPFAIGGAHNFARFYQKDDPRGDSLHEYLASDHETKNIDHGYELLTNVVTISQLFLVIGRSDRVTLKLDCEGAEYGILDGLLDSHAVRAPWFERIDSIMVEFHNIGAGFTRVDSLMARFEEIGKPLAKWMH